MLVQKLEWKNLLKWRKKRKKNKSKPKKSHKLPNMWRFALANRIEIRVFQAILSDPASNNSPDLHITVQTLFFKLSKILTELFIKSFMQKKSH